MANLIEFPVINLKVAGRNILRLRMERQLTVRELQIYFRFKVSMATGDNLPSLDNVVAHSKLFGVPIEPTGKKETIPSTAKQRRKHKSLLFLMAA